MAAKFEGWAKSSAYHTLSVKEASKLHLTGNKASLAITSISEVARALSWI